ncbi:MAG: GNAT family N-acetyltransferase [Oscillospiraceae bacterium]|nr:GNAT family N-acetyltransferase [Oscillospiraceae bacterium]
MEIRKFEKQDVPTLMKIWNDVVEEGQAFPQEETLTVQTAEEFFSSQSFTAAAVDNGEVVGLYILHPNNVGRCGHIANASYAVRTDIRGRQVGRRLVTHCLEKCRELGFRVLQFNAVVADNAPALALYKSLGFVQLGVIPGGFRKKDGSYADIIPHYFDVTKL